MATQVQWRGGSTTEHATFTGAAREVTVDTQKKTLVVHDGSTAGGEPLLREDGSNSALALGSAAAPALKFTGDTNTGIYSPGADQVAISTGGTQRINIEADGDINIDSGGVFYDASTNRLAVGNTNPSTTFQVGVNGTATASLRSAATYVSIDAGYQTAAANGTAANPCLIFGGDGNTGFWHPAADTVALSNSGSESLRIDSSGRLLVGTSSSTSIGTREASLQLSSEALAPNLISVLNTRADQFGPSIAFAKSRGGVSPTVQANDLLGTIIFSGHDSTDLNSSGAYIQAAVDGAVSNNNLPTRLVFSTTADGATSPTPRMTIKSSGIVNVGNTPVYADNAAAKAGGLVDGDFYRKSDGTLMIVYT